MKFRPVNMADSARVAINVHVLLEQHALCPIETVSKPPLELGIVLSFLDMLSYGSADDLCNRLGLYVGNCVERFGLLG